MSFLKEIIFDFFVILLKDIAYVANAFLSCIGSSALLAVIYLYFLKVIIKDYDFMYFNVFVGVWFLQVLIRTAMTGLPVSISIEKVPNTDKKENN